ncbi:MAG: hypothetical protein V4555_10520 [Acidobacteriota bacterium]
MRMMAKAGVAAVVMAAMTMGAQKPVVNPGNNPLLGSWVFASGGLVKGACAKSRSFAAKSQTFEAFGKIQTRDVNAYAVSGKTIYVQERPGSGGTVAYEMVGANEMMDTLGTGACHWKRK